MSESKKFNVLLVAAEASSELYARRIMEEVHRRQLPVQFFGIGSHKMAEDGFEPVEKSENMAVVGLYEVLAHWKTISQAFKNLVLKAKALKPRAALLLDYPDFNLRLAKKLYGLKIPVLYFISPQVWAWRTGRVHLIKKIISKMLVVFPFEKDFYEKFNVPVSFVGHPLLDEIATRRLTADERNRHRQQIGVLAEEFLVGLLPGSRESELKYNLLTQLKAAELLNSQKQSVKFVLLVAPTFEIEIIKDMLPADMQVSIRLVKDDPIKVLQLCDACLVASGTATLMTGLAETPMVIMYKMNPMTGFLAKKLVRGTHFGMANLILGETAVPELFQEMASPENLCHELAKYIDDSCYLLGVKAKLSQIKFKLGEAGAVRRVVDELEKALQ